MQGSEVLKSEHLGSIIQNCGMCGSGEQESAGMEEWVYIHSRRDLREKGSYIKTEGKGLQDSYARGQLPCMASRRYSPGGKTGDGAVGGSVEDENIFISGDEVEGYQE